MQALPLSNFGGGDGSTIETFFRDLAGDVESFEFLIFLMDVFRLNSGEAELRLFFVFLLTAILGASGEVDMSRPGSLKASATSISSNFLLFLFRFLTSFIASDAVTWAEIFCPMDRAGRLLA